MALTLENTNATGVTTIVYDNNGIETGYNGGFYNNLGGAVGSDATKPGFSDFYSSSNYFPLVFASYFKLDRRDHVHADRRLFRPGCEPAY